jgi:predicted nucleic acid-binding Zn ribbon protein
MSKFMYFDFKCATCAATVEMFVKPDFTPICEKCGSELKRLISAPCIKLPGTDPSFPGEYSKWEKKRRTKAAEDKKFYDKHGVDKMHHSYGS